MDAPITPARGSDVLQGAATEKRDLLARLLGRLAHEIRNPLSSLDIHVQLLQEDLAHVPAATRTPLGERLQIIRGELTRLENIVQRFLRLASPTALELEPVDLTKLVSHVCQLLEPEAKGREVAIVPCLSPAIPILTADSVQLTQALLNLVINALQAVERRGLIQVRVSPSAPDRAVFIEVQDSGPGVPADRLATVFEPYFTTKEEGSGLGLWIAQQIAVAHGGSLQVSNPPEGGALFRLSLPWAGEDHHG